MDTRTKPRSFFDALEAHGLAKAATSHAVQLQPSASMEPYQKKLLHSFDIALDQSNKAHTIWLACYTEGTWMEPYQALELAAQLQSYANLSILLRAQAAIATTEHRT